MYCGFIGADGGADSRRLAARQHGRLARLRGMSRMAELLAAVAAGGRRRTQPGRPAVDGPRCSNSRGRSPPINSGSSRYRKTSYVRAACIDSLQARGIDAILCPPHALPAMQHGKGFDLLAAASYAFLFNLLGFPAGIVSLTRVRAGEDNLRPDSRDKVLRSGARRRSRAASACR